MNGKEILQWRESEQGLTARPVIEPESGADQTAVGLEALSKPELIGLVKQLQAHRLDFAAPAARLMFLLTVAVIPWRLRMHLLRRPAPPIYGDYTDFLLFIPDILLLATLLFWMLSLALQPRKIETAPVFISLPLAGLTLMGMLSVIFSADPALSAYHALRLVLLYGFYLYILNEIRSLEILVTSAGLLVFTQAFVGIAQVLAQRSINLQILGEHPLDPAWSGVSIASANGVRFLRAYGLSDHPNILGGCLAFALLVLGVKYIATTSAAWRALVSALFGLGALALLASFSRSAWLAFTGGWLLALGVLYRTQQIQAWKRWLSLSLGSLILLSPFLLYLSPFLGIRLGITAAFNQTPAEEQSIGERQLLNQAANQLFSEKPLTGVGLGAFPSALRARHPEFPLNYQPAHIVLLAAASETGLLGALFYLILWLAPWLAMLIWRKRLHFTPPLLAASALLLGISLVGLFDYYPWLLVPGRLWSWLAWGFWGASFLRARKTAGAYV